MVAERQYKTEGELFSVCFVFKEDSWIERSWAKGTQFIPMAPTDPQVLTYM